MKEVQFKISSALKNLIGKELITDEFVAVFELVKNSFDANAKKVKVIFENQYNPQASKILIWDDGRGMNLDDLNNKWLFVGYSAKKDGSEDKDYRDKLKNKRTFAGAKGVGRFSCDRLGAHLDLFTKKELGNYEKLSINWADFEKDAKREFMNVRVLHQTLANPPFHDFESGTILVISQLRDQWDRERILVLKNSLEKLINPNQANEDDSFPQDFHVEGFRQVSCLERVQGDARSEEHCWDSVVCENLVVGDPVEYPCEVLASIVSFRQFYMSSVESVAHVQQFKVFLVESVSSEHYHVVPAPGFQWGKGTSGLIDVHHQADFVFRDGFPGQRILQVPVLYHFPEGCGAGHVHFLGVKGHEYYVMSVNPSGTSHG